MLQAIKAGLTLAVAIIVIQMFLPEVGTRLVELIVKVLDVMLVSIDQVNSTDLVI